MDNLLKEFQSLFDRAAPDEKKRLTDQVYLWAEKQTDPPVLDAHPGEGSEDRKHPLPASAGEGGMQSKPQPTPTLVDIQKLIENEIHLRQIAGNIEQVFWLRDIRMDRILYVSPAFETVWGRSGQSFYEDPLVLIDSVHPEDRVKVLSASPEDNREQLTQSYRILRPDGSLRWISAHTFLIGDDPSVPSYQVCIAQDITEQNLVDQTLRKALDRSREQFTLSRRMSLARTPEAVLKTLMSASKLRTAKRAFVIFFESTISGVSHEIEVVASWSSSPDLTITPIHGNETLNEASLFEDLALLGLFHPSKPVLITEIFKDDRLNPGVRDLLSGDDIHTLAIFPLVALGNWLGCLLVLFPQEMHFIPDELRHIKVLVDQATITLYNLQLLETEAESRHEAERANEIKTRFLAMISHELRTPLTSIIGFTTTLLAEDVTWEADEQLDFIHTIQQEANRLQELIDHLLVLSRLEAGMLPIVLEPHPLQEIMKDAMPQFHALTGGQKFSVDLPADLPPVNADPKRIAQVLVNLVRNAAAYAPKETEIFITASVRGDFVQVDVIDQGPGIPQSERKRVFQAFRRGINEASIEGKGAGLGLAICKGLVEAHKGRIWIKRKDSPGATFSFTIPLARSNSQAAPSGEVQ